jgi:hypothetical protein
MPTLESGSVSAIVTDPLREDSGNRSHNVGSDFTLPDFKHGVTKPLKRRELLGVLLGGAFLGFVYWTIWVIAGVGMPVRPIDLDYHVASQQKIDASAEEPCLRVADSSLTAEIDAAPGEFLSNNRLDLGDGRKLSRSHCLPLIVRGKRSRSRIAELLAGSSTDLHPRCRGMSPSFSWLIAVGMPTRTKSDALANEPAANSLSGNFVAVGNFFKGQAALVIVRDVIVDCTLFKAILASAAAKGMFHATLFGQVSVIGKPAIKLQAAAFAGERDGWMTFHV